jgi:hypothetical protein
VIDDVLALVPDDRRSTKELRAAPIELITPVCATAADARALHVARRIGAG